MASIVHLASRFPRNSLICSDPPYTTRKELRPGVGGKGNVQGLCKEADAMKGLSTRGAMAQENRRSNARYGGWAT